MLEGPRGEEWGQPLGAPASPQLETGTPPAFLNSANDLHALEMDSLSEAPKGTAHPHLDFWPCETLNKGLSEPVFPDLLASRNAA